HLYPYYILSSLFFTCSATHRDLHSFPTRRSSDLYHPCAINNMHRAVLVGGIATAVAVAGYIAYQQISRPAFALEVDATKDTTDKIGRHTSELQSRGHLVCRLLLEKKKKLCLVLNK